MHQIGTVEVGSSVSVYLANLMFGLLRHKPLVVSSVCLDSVQSQTMSCSAASALGLAVSSSCSLLRIPLLTASIAILDKVCILLLSWLQVAGVAARPCSEARMMYVAVDFGPVGALHAAAKIVMSASALG